MSELDSTDDALLWDNFRTGKDQAFILIYNRFVNLLFQYGTKFTPDDQLVKDCIQELFVEIYNNRSTLGSTDNIKFYLYVSLKRKIIKSLQSQNLFSRLTDSELPFLIEYNHIDNYEEITTVKRDKIQLALNQLTSRQKEAIYLRFIVNLSYEEISKTMNMKYQSIRNLIFRSLESLRSIISEE